MGRKVAADLDAEFERTRHEIGLDADKRLIASIPIEANSGTTISARSDRAPVAAQSKKVFTLSEIYARYLNDPTKKRSARTNPPQDRHREGSEGGPAEGWRDVGNDRPCGIVGADPKRELVCRGKWGPAEAGPEIPMDISEGAAVRN